MEHSRNGVYGSSMPAALSDAKKISNGTHQYRPAEMKKNEKSNQMLATLDKQKFSLYHMKAILVAGVGFFTDAYDLFIINLVVPMIGFVYFEGHMPVMSESFVKSAATLGTLLGQILFGVLADVLGRKKMYGIELAIMIVGTFGSALSANTVRGVSIIHMLVFWRFFIGLGIGGDYPLSAVITSEYASVNRRGQMMAAVFAMQGIGILVAATVALVTLACFRHLIDADPMNVDYVWRICTGFGIVPALAAVYFRLTLPETPRYTMQVLGNLHKAESDIKTVTTNGKVDSNNLATNVRAADVKKASLRDFAKHFSKLANLKVLIGCASTWFFLDIGFYGIGLNQSTVLDAIGFNPHQNATVYEKLFTNAGGNALVSLMGTVPGYWVTVGLIEIMGRLGIQYMGFVVLTVILTILSAAYNAILNTSIALFIVIYCIGLFFFNFGPNTTTFIIPGEVFPTRYRSTGHGISAATGKLGALVTALATPPVQKIYGTRVVLGIFAVCMFLGTLMTILVPETKKKSLEELGDDSLETETSEC